MSTLRTFFDIDGDMDWVVVDTNASTVNNKGYIVDTSTGPVTLILPSTPTEGSVVGIKDLNGNFSTNNLTISRNGNLINGLAQNKVINLDGYGGEFIFSGVTQGWVLYSESDDSIQPHIASTSNPHATTKSQVGLGNVDNTTDLLKPLSTATSDALALKLNSSSYTAADVLSKLSTVDGTGSGIDADLLDGHDTSYFQTALGFTPENAANKNTSNGYAGLTGGLISYLNIPDATQSLIGGMSAADKTKLDGIEAGAGADMTAAEILTAIKTVDGALSGLDADTLDGHDTSYFQTALGFTPENSANRNATNGYPGLTSGKIDYNQLPAIAITNTFVVGSQALMLALTCETGDVAVRTDLNKSFILQGTVPSTLTDWQELLTPTDAIQSIAVSAPITTTGGASPTLGITASTTGAAGSMSAADKTKLDGIAAGAQVNVATDLTTTRTAGEIYVYSSTGTDITLQAAATTLAGLMTSTDKTKLDGIAAGAQVNVAADLSLGTITTTTIPVNCSTGTDITLPAATTSLAGLLSSADKTKLDGIEAGAGGDMTAAEILTAIKTVDGSASGLDADLLDGLSSGSFLRSDVNNAGNLYLGATDGLGITYWGIANAGLFGSWMSVATNVTYGGRITGDTTSDYNMYFRMAGGTNRGFVFETAYGTKIMSVNPTAVIANSSMLVSGNVGIGTLAPAQKLDVAGKVTALNGYNTGSFDMVYNSTTQSLDFNFIG